MHSKNGGKETTDYSRVLGDNQISSTSFELSIHLLKSVNKLPKVLDLKEGTQRQQSRTADSKIEEA